MIAAPSKSANQHRDEDHMPWIAACAEDAIDKEDVWGWDHGGRSFAIFRSPNDEFFCTDGLCTHEQVELSDGLVLDYVIECPKHNGQFDYRTGEAKRSPACENLRTYPVRREDGQILVLVE
ncbi:MocE family 2Fe-2S type ferredoxin [Rhizobium esperanzae]|uniref:MocE family 2Fe-2S type ferredoxin n=1 Tax=Rhizobium esperanzae TaxID=1967781 RepID=UPI003CCA6582